MDANLQKKENRSMFIPMHKTQVQMDQRLQYKFDYTEPDRRESGKQPSMHRNRRPLPKYNTVSQTLRATINKRNFLKLRSFCKAKDEVNKTKKPKPNEWEKIFTNPTSDRGLRSKIYKLHKKLDIKIPNKPIKK